MFKYTQDNMCVEPQMRDVVDTEWVLPRPRLDDGTGSNSTRD
jgi:hypothetical protein